MEKPKNIYQKKSLICGSWYLKKWIAAIKKTKEATIDDLEVGDHFQKHPSEEKLMGLTSANVVFI